MNLWQMLVFHTLLYTLVNELAAPSWL